MADYVKALDAAFQTPRLDSEGLRKVILGEAKSSLEEQLRKNKVGEKTIADELTALDVAYEKLAQQKPAPPGFRALIKFGPQTDDEKKKGADAIEARRARMALDLIFQFNNSNHLPRITIPTFLEFGDNTAEGKLVTATGEMWRQVLEILRQNPDAAYEIDPHQWEEIIAGAYEKEGYEVVLTPRSGDFGRDIIATKNGVGSVRIYDQVKAYKPGTIVPADDAAHMIGTLTAFQNVSKGIITTTSTFAPRILEDPRVKPFLPYRLELRDRDALLPWLTSLI
jgi:restriction system protein